MATRLVTVDDILAGHVTLYLKCSPRHLLPDGGGVIVVGRRVPGVNGLRWVAVYDDPAQRQDPVAQVARLLAEAARP